MSILIFQHHDIGTPGRLGATLRDHGFRLDIRRLDLPPDHPLNAKAKPRPGWFPPDLDGVEGVILLGGPQNVGEDHPWMPRQAEIVREAHERRLPVLGICLGAQIIAHALGGEVAKMPAPEVGFHTVGITSIGQTEAVLAGIAWDSPQYQSHECEITKLPADAILLARSEMCAVQAFRSGLRTYGFQYHFECDRPMLDALAAADRDWLAAAGITPQAWAEDVDRHYEMYARLADRLCINFITYALPLQLRASA